jgi:predicted GIY-YIG superfamily endonuclease
MERPAETGLFVMAFWVYILQSQSTGRYYCGYSSDPERRLRQHNDPEYSEEIKDLASQAKKEGAQRVLDHTEEVLQWLNSIL